MSPSLICALKRIERSLVAGGGGGAGGEGGAWFLGPGWLGGWTSPGWHSATGEPLLQSLDEVSLSSSHIVSYVDSIFIFYC
jgi:hypothetical protein